MPNSTQVQAVVDTIVRDYWSAPLNRSKAVSNPAAQDDVLEEIKSLLRDAGHEHIAETINIVPQSDNSHLQLQISAGKDSLDFPANIRLYEDSADIRNTNPEEEFGKLAKAALDTADFAIREAAGAKHSAVLKPDAEKNIKELYEKFKTAQEAFSKTTNQKESIKGQKKLIAGYYLAVSKALYVVEKKTIASRLKDFTNAFKEKKSKNLFSRIKAAVKAFRQSTTDKNLVERFKKEKDRFLSSEKRPIEANIFVGAKKGNMSVIRLSMDSPLEEKTASNEYRDEVRVANLLKSDNKFYTVKGNTVTKESAYSDYRSASNGVKGVISKKKPVFKSLFGNAYKKEEKKLYLESAKHVFKNHLVTNIARSQIHGDGPFTLKLTEHSLLSALSERTDEKSNPDWLIVKAMQEAQSYHDGSKITVDGKDVTIDANLFTTGVNSFRAVNSGGLQDTINFKGYSKLLPNALDKLDLDNKIPGSEAYKNYKESKEMLAHQNENIRTLNQALKDKKESLSNSSDEYKNLGTALLDREPNESVYEKITALAIEHKTNSEKEKSGNIHHVDESQRQAQKEAYDLFFKINDSKEIQKLESEISNIEKAQTITHKEFYEKTEDLLEDLLEDLNRQHTTLELNPEQEKLLKATTNFSKVFSQRNSRELELNYALHPALNQLNQEIRNNETNPTVHHTEKTNCKSGKDRTGLAKNYAEAVETFKAIYDRLPTPPPHNRLMKTNITEYNDQLAKFKKDNNNLIEMLKPHFYSSASVHTAGNNTTANGLQLSTKFGIQVLPKAAKTGKKGIDTNTLKKIISSYKPHGKDAKKNSKFANMFKSKTGKEIRNKLIEKIAKKAKKKGQAVKDSMVVDISAVKAKTKRPRTDRASRIEMMKNKSPVTPKQVESDPTIHTVNPLLAVKPVSSTPTAPEQESSDKEYINPLRSGSDSSISVTSSTTTRTAANKVLGDNLIAYRGKKLIASTKNKRPTNRSQ